MPSVLCKYASVVDLSVVWICKKKRIFLFQSTSRMNRQSDQGRFIATASRGHVPTIPQSNCRMSDFSWRKLTSRCAQPRLHPMWGRVTWWGSLQARLQGNARDQGSESKKSQGRWRAETNLGMHRSIGEGEPVVVNWHHHHALTMAGWIEIWGTRSVKLDAEVALMDSPERGAWMHRDPPDRSTAVPPSMPSTTVACRSPWFDAWESAAPSMGNAMMCRLGNLPTQMPAGEGPPQRPWPSCHCQDLEAWVVSLLTLVGSIIVCGERDFYCSSFTVSFAVFTAAGFLVGSSELGGAPRIRWILISTNR